MTRRTAAAFLLTAAMAILTTVNVTAWAGHGRPRSGGEAGFWAMQSA